MYQKSRGVKLKGSSTLPHQFNWRSHGIGLALLLISIGRMATAQDYLSQTGSPTFSVAQPVQYGFVNLANGNVHLEIPLASAPQRGNLAFSAKMVYDSRIWQIVKVGGNLLWKPTNIPNSIGGWRFATSADPGIVTSDQLFVSCDDAGSQLLTFSNFVWQSPDGTRRRFAINTALLWQGSCAGDTPTGDAYATDSSGYHMYVTNYSDAKVYAKDGTQVYPKVEDTNGNYFSTDASGNVIDTLGRTVVRKIVNGSQTFYDVMNSQGTTSRITVTTKQIPVHTLFLQSQVAEDQEIITVLDQILLPSGDSYSFTYDQSTTDPNGSFTPGYGLVAGNYQNVVDPFGIVNRWATSTMDASIAYLANPGTIQATLTRNGGTEQLVFTLNNGAWLTSATTRTGNTVVQQVTNTYDFGQTCPPNPNPGVFDPCSGPVNIRLLKSVVSDGGGTKQTVYGYDDPRFGNINLIQSWNYFSGATPPAGPDHQTAITMHPVIGQNILNRIQTVVLKDGAGNPISQTNYSYDGTALATPANTIINNDTSIGTNRGNLTQISQWTGSSFLSTNLKYDTSGQLISVQDAAGNLTTVDYADRFFNDAGAGQTFGSPNANPSVATNAYPTSIILPTGTITQGYYFGSGKLAYNIDQNNQQTTQHYTEPLDRVTQIVGPKGWQALTYASLFSYDAFTGLTDTQPSISCTGCIHLKNTLDQQGRIVGAVLQSDPDGPVTSTVSYDPMGNVLTASNPTRTGTGAAATNSYDVIYRLTNSQNPDGSTAQIFYDGSVPAAGGAPAQLCPSATYGLGAPVLGVNELGQKHQIWQNAFGQLIEADEPDSSNALTVATCYQYNAAGQLTQVIQGNLSRSYQYDPLGRLTQVTTPESGSVTYSYVNDDGTLCSGDPSNVCKRVDARGIASRYKYDGSGRLTSTAYSDGTPTALVNYGESSALGVTLSNTVDRPSSIYTKDGTGKILTGEVFSYDAAGNIINDSQCAPQNCGIGVFQNTYTTDQMGNIVGMGNNWGRSVSSAFNTAGQVTSLTVSTPDATHPGTILSNVKYNAFGAMTLASLGDGSTQAMDYSGARGWLESMRIGSLAPANSPGGNAASPGQGAVTIQGILRQSTGAAAGRASITITGGERSISNGAGTPGTGTLTISGQEQFKQVAEVPAVGGTGSVTINGAVQSKQVITQPASAGTGVFTVNGALQTKAAVAAIPAIGSVAFSGSEQSKPGSPATIATGSVTIQGAERSKVDLSNCNIVNHIQVCHTIYDRGSVSLTVNGVLGSCGFSQTANTTSTAIATCLASAITNAATSPVTATASGSTISMTARSPGTSGNYAFSVSSSWDTADFSGPAYSGNPASAQLTGGQDTGPTIYDAGICTVTINGTSYQASFGQGSSTNSIASALATTISNGGSVTATVSGATLQLTANTAGTTGNYPLTSNCSFNSSQFAGGSFSSSTSGSSFTGGTNAIPAVMDSGTLTLKVGPTFTASACYGPGGSCAAMSGCAIGDSTSAQLACALASSGNANGLNRAGSPVTASVTAGSSTISIQASNAGASTNYSLSNSSTFNSVSFSAASFSAVLSGPTMTGGKDAVTNTVYDSGTVKVSVGNYTASIPYGQVQVPGTISWNGQDLTTLTGGAQISVGMPSSFAGDSVSPQHVFFTDANKHVHEQWLDSAATWHDQDVTIASGSSVTNTCGVVTSFALPGSSSLEHVFFVDASQHIREQYTDAIGQWHNRDITVVSGAATTPWGCGVSGFSTPNSSSPEHLVYIDTNGHVHEVWADSTGNWHERDNTGAYGTPAVAQNTNPVFFAGNTSAPEHLLYVDANQHIREQYSDSGGLWHDQDLTAVAGGANTGTNPPSSPAVFFDAGGSEQIFYSGADGDIHHMWNDAVGWHDEDALALAGHSGFVGSGVTLPRSLVAFQGSNGSKHLFYADTAIYHLWNDSNGWQQETLPLEAAVVTAFFDGVNLQVFIATTDMVHFSTSQAAPTYQLVNSTAAQIASALVNDPNTGLNVGASPVDATVSGSTLTLHARQGGQASNFAQSVSSVYDTVDFPLPSFSGSLSGPTLTGGADGITTPLYDSGTLSVSINNHVNLITWGEGATPQSMASALAADINQDTGASVTAGAQGNIVTFTARVPGANTNYTYVPNMIHNLVDFPQPSFTFQPSVTSAPTLQGGSGGIFDTGTITVTVNGHSTTINYGQTSTFLADNTGIYNRLATAINSDPNSAVWACCNGPLSLIAKKTGTASNYAISVTSVTNNSNFTGTSFPVSASGVMLSGGLDTGGSFSDTGVATLSIGSFTVSTSYGSQDPFNFGCCNNPTPSLPPSTASGIATALVQAINQAPNAPVIAAASSNNSQTVVQISLIAKNGGSATNYSLASSLVSNDPAHFPSASFVMSPTSSVLTGGADKPNPSAASSSLATLIFGLGTTVSSSSTSSCGINLTVNGTVYAPCLTTSFPGPADFASAVANTINTTLNSPVTATASGSNVVIRSVSAGASTIYPIAASVSGGPIGVVTSGPALSGGTDGAAGESTGFVYALDLGIDPSGTIFAANDSVNGNWSYFYDNLNRLQQASTPTIGYAYDYDRYGNRLHQTPLNGGNGLSLVYVNNQISATGVTYDASGNMTSDGTHTYAYDAENRLISVDGGQTATYIYSADGRRVRATVGANSTDFIYDLGGEVAGVMRSDGTLLRQEIGGLATYSDVAYFHHRDWLGNLRVVTDYSGAIRQTCTNLPYGDALSCTSAGITPTHFTGYMRDAESNLDFANARYYTSQYGRFMSVDPMGGDAADPQSLNSYSYVGNSPLSATDSSGMSIDSPTTYGIDVPFVFNGGTGFSSGSQFKLPSFGSLSFSGVSFGGTFPGSASGFGDSPAPGSLGLCGVIAGCGGSFDAAPPGPSKGQLGAEAAFNSAPGAGSSASLSVRVGNFINSACNSVCDWILNEKVSNFFAGAGDALTGRMLPFVHTSLTEWIRGKMGADSVVGKGSFSYKFGGFAGSTVGWTLVGSASAVGAAVSNGKNGALFGRGTQTLFNSSKVRFGWSWQGSAATGRDVIRLGIGAARGTNWWSHIPFYYP